MKLRHWTGFKMQRKYIHTVNFIVIGILGGTSLYLWKEKTVLQSQIVSNVVQEVDLLQNFEESEPTVTVTARSVQQETSAPETVKGIDPFEQIEIRRSKELNRTLKWLDLWGDDPNCTKFDVTLLEEKSVESRALVSFPGSGNTWLRMLLMGITGVYINSVYGGDDALFESKGSLPVYGEFKTLKKKQFKYLLPWQRSGLSRPFYPQYRLFSI